MGDFKFSRNSKKNIKGCKESVIELANRVIVKSPYDFGIPQYGGLRTAQEQNNLFHRVPKVTQLDGFRRKSYHQSGWAFDIFIYHDGKACWDCIDFYKAVWEEIEKEFYKMKEEGKFDKDQFIEWGGNWKRFKDYPHFQIKLK